MNDKKHFLKVVNMFSKEGSFFIYTDREYPIWGRTY